MVTAYSPVAKNKLADNETLMAVARRRDVTPVQVLLSWGIRRGTAVIPKTEKEDRMRENITVCHHPSIPVTNCSVNGCLVGGALG